MNHSNHSAGPGAILGLLLAACTVASSPAATSDDVDLTTETATSSGSSGGSGGSSGPGGPGGSGGSGGSGSLEESTGSSSGEMTSSSSGSSSGSSSTSGAPDTCGDGLVQPGERCDDQNADDDDLCNNDCQDRQRVFLSPPVPGPGIGEPDVVCQTAADDAGLVGTFRAWIALDGTTPAERFTRDSGWYVMIGADWPRVARGFEDLESGQLEHPIDRDAFGAWVDDPQPLVWTGLTALGTLGEADCNNWQDKDASGQVGFYHSLGALWTHFAVVDCDQDARLYCFEQRSGS